ncbi:four-carbon acid sugar kinase family protein [Halorussus sp. AFM4]|uniref:four-carbon acid sugar kinase family protein n=1 Tax=Halorussus sp. AFM4 TaxID=3421651 RepID=UPI003EC0ED10
MTDNLLFAYYGDDLTGSTDAMEALGLSGVRTALFLEPPSEDDLTGRFSNLQAVGVAGRSRSMTPAQMDDVLPVHFQQLGDLDPPLVQYKVCSTFDSSPDVGSIGHAIDLAQAEFDSPFVPLAVGVPALQRYVVFGHLFATADGFTYRIDRHPTMSEHPVTPMTESDLGRHLGQQTDRGVERFTVLDLEDDGVDTAFARVVGSHPEIVMFDTINASHLQTVGRLVWTHAVESRDQPMFAVGSSGLDYALASYWNRIGAVSPPESTPVADSVDQIAVMSGSASPETAAQIEAALDSDSFVGVRLDTPTLVTSDAQEERKRAITETLSALELGKSVILYSARGPNDSALQRTREAAADTEQVEDVGARLGREQGRIFRRILLEHELSRVCIAGGDTSGHVAPALDIFALEFESPVAPGTPLCVASSTDDRFDRLEIALKGGQTGSEQFFENVRRGYSDHWP